MRPGLLSRALSLLPERGGRPELEHYLEMLRDYPQRGGKGIRSELLLASARVHGAQPGTAAWEGALWLATALELFQHIATSDITNSPNDLLAAEKLGRYHAQPAAEIYVS